MCDVEDIKNRWQVRLGLLPAATQDTHDVVALIAHIEDLEWLLDPTLSAEELKAVQEVYDVPLLGGPFDV